MGQQQLLLIVLSVIIVGISVVVGIEMFASGAASANLDAVIADANQMGADAQAWYRKPVNLGGGGRSFENLTLAILGVPPDGAGTGFATENGGYTMSTPTSPFQQFTITGVGNEDGDGDGTDCTITLTVQPDDIAVVVNNR